MEQVGPDGHGIPPAPYSLRAVLDEMETARQMIDDLWLKLITFGL